METSPHFSQSLLSMIEGVYQAETSSQAFYRLLSPLLKLFDMDQAAVVEYREGRVKLVYALDFTHRILTEVEHLLTSTTLIREAIDTGEPVVHQRETDADMTAPSLHELKLKNVVVVPLEVASGRVLYLASRRNPFRSFSEIQIRSFKAAATAAALSLEQNKKFVQLKQSTIEAEKKSSVNTHPLVWRSPAMDRVVAEVSQIAPYNVSVLIQGESGVGKEVVAREIHRRSERRGKFLAINCANLTESLLESELFGYVRGAFTGAVQNKKGLFVEAADGTFFLDEIAELPLSLQSKLLRVLQERVLRPVGAVEDIPVDLRFVAASHRDLREAVREGKFREDLFYRIQEFTVFIPPLRERREDIEVLGAHFMREYSQEFKLKERRLEAEALRKVLEYDWPGNVRELKNVCKLSVILSKSEQVEAESLRLGPPQRAQNEDKSSVIDLPLTGPMTLRALSRSFEIKTVKNLLAEVGATQTSVAQRLGISVRTLQRILTDGPEEGEESSLVDSRHQS